VFECYLDEGLLEDLKAWARRLLDLSQDALRIYGVQGEVQVLGAGPVYGEVDFVVVLWGRALYIQRCPRLPPQPVPWARGPGCVSGGSPLGWGFCACWHGGCRCECR